MVSIRFFRCAEKSCGAVFTVLPAFIARHLWRDWETVTEVTEGRARAPATTRRRWLARLRSAALQLLQVVTSTVQGAVTEALTRRHPATRAVFVETLAPFLAAVAPSFALAAAWIHRLEAGVRLM